MDQIGSFGPANVTPSPRPKPPLSTVDTHIKATRFDDHFEAANHFSQPGAIGTFSRARIDAEEAEAEALAKQQAQAEAEALQEALEEARLLKQGGRIVVVPNPVETKLPDQVVSVPTTEDTASEPTLEPTTAVAPEPSSDIEIVEQAAPVLTVPELPITPTNVGRRRNS